MTVLWKPCEGRKDWWQTVPTVRVTEVCGAWVPTYFREESLCLKVDSCCVGLGIIWCFGSREKSCIVNRYLHEKCHYRVNCYEVETVHRPVGKCNLTGTMLKLTRMASFVSISEKLKYSEYLPVGLVCYTQVPQGNSQWRCGQCFWLTARRSWV